MSVDTAPRPTGPAPAPGRANRGNRSGKTGSGMVGASQGGRWWLYLVLVVALIAVIAPFVWMVLGSFKSEGELRQVPPTWLPQSASLDNYTQLFSKLNFGQFFTNSIVVAVVVTVGAIKGGVRENIIPDSVELRGTIRTFDEGMRDDVHERVRDTAEHISQAARAGCDVCITKNYPVTINDAELTAATLPTLERIAIAVAEHYHSEPGIASVISADRISAFRFSWMRLSMASRDERISVTAASSSGE
mgnify:CR=1 FL=1